MRTIKWYMGNRPKLLVSIIIVGAIWIGFLFGHGGKHANIFSHIFFDKSFLILPIISISIIACGFCVEYRKRLMLKFILSFNVFLVICLFMGLSIWTVIRVENHTDHPVTAVSIDCARNVMRIVKLPPKKERTVALTNSGNRESVADDRYIITVYDKHGKVYFQENIRSGDVERVHTIEIRETDSAKVYRGN
ncbi:MAG: hypothetical protein KAR47_21485, partial [Planctomycetes bacterium]|nr:hypothetical protein [Planctomycetota bacterium]